MSMPRVVMLTGPTVMQNSLFLPWRWPKPSPIGLLIAPIRPIATEGWPG